MYIFNFTRLKKCSEAACSRDHWSDRRNIAKHMRLYIHRLKRLEYDWCATQGAGLWVLLTRGKSSTNWMQIKTGWNKFFFSIVRERSRTVDLVGWKRRAPRHLAHSATAAFHEVCCSWSTLLTAWRSEKVIHDKYFIKWKLQTCITREPIGRSEKKR